MPPLDTEDGQRGSTSPWNASGGIEFIVFDNFMSLCASDLRDEEAGKA